MSNETFVAIALTVAIIFLVSIMLLGTLSGCQVPLR